jgi:quinol monooxygenase YgiN
MSKFVLFIKTKTKPGQRDEVHTLWEKFLRDRAAANAAQEIYCFSYDESDPDVFYLFEVYKDRASFEANGRSPWFAEYMGAVGPMLAGPPEVGFAKPIWAKGFPL